MSYGNTKVETMLRACTAFRRNGADALLIKPVLDGDGEFDLTLDELGTALRILGFNHMDVFLDA